MGPQGEDRDWNGNSCVDQYLPSAFSFTSTLINSYLSASVWLQSKVIDAGNAAAESARNAVNAYSPLVIFCSDRSAESRSRCRVDFCFAFY
ncbi:hypothetical protein CDAR_94371 [Caerostris darwini]|uniref:Uncharacterized protein n=1 Tax=Caerostris darwini TaxID=1538125 RepID=A0AAV4VPS4_9ARAC|nr:hypothetical protein CDAR_94371 [Caerostris darwini]